MIVRRILILTVAALAAAVGMPAAAQPDPLAEIENLLHDRAAAMMAGDRDAYLAPVAHDDAAFVERQGRLFDGFQKLGLAEYRLDLGTTWPELTGMRERQRYGQGVKVLHVEERSRVRGYDVEPALEDLYLTFVQRNGRWQVVSDTDLGDLSLLSSRRLWEFGPIVMRKSRHFLYVSHPKLASSSRPVLDSAEEALRRVGRRWPLAWRRQVIILAPSTTAELERMIQATFDLDVFVAFASSGVDRAEDWNLVGHRILLNWPTFNRYPPSTRENILTHELLHVATREDSGPMLPIFLEEGVAEWVAGDDGASLLSNEIQDKTFDRRLPLDYEFTTGSGSDIIVAYQESSAAVRYAADRFGDRSVAELYENLGRVRREQGTWRYHTDQAMRMSFGEAYGPFQRDWAAWAEDTLG